VQSALKSAGPVPRALTKARSYRLASVRGPARRTGRDIPFEPVEVAIRAHEGTAPQLGKPEGERILMFDGVHFQPRFGKSFDAWIVYCIN
jgi:hypothetical protein